jgi:NAD(P)-dependent dehydrogenase (short-subunit alcohol dehydrogenase family)
MKLNDTISAVVTGGASGLGAATAAILAAQGVKVAILDVNDAVGEAHAKAIGGRFFRCDVTDTASIEAALSAARDAHGIARIVVNCAGIAIGKRMVRRDRDTGATEPHDNPSFERVIAINLIGTFSVMSRAASAMMTLPPLDESGERGVMVATASVAAEDGQIGQVAYAASKGGVASMILPVARDLAKEGIRVVGIMPGLFETPMFAGLPDDAKQALAANVPFPPRLGRPDEYAALVKQICENQMLNGTCIRLDGAIRLPPR